MPTNPTKKRSAKKKIHQRRLQNYRLKRWIILGVLLLTLAGTAFYLKEKIQFYYAMYFNKFVHKKLRNSASESAKINRILGENADKVFGIDISHYQNREDIKWDSLSLGNRTIPIKFIVMRATMGNQSADRNFPYFWKTAKENNLIRGAYHFYRPDEDPVIQANNFLKNIKLEKGDLRPILDIEHEPIKKSREKLVTDLKIWLKIVEEKYGVKPIIYTYSYYYKDFLGDNFTEYPLWIANYNDVENPAPELDWKIWQFSENGIVYGINTKVDVNFYNGGLWSFENLTLD